MASPVASRLTVSRLNYSALLVCLVGLLSSASVQAQQRNGPDPMESYRILMEERRRMSERAVAETLRRRFEEHKDEARLPSETAVAGAKPGVVRAVSLAEQQALAHTEKGLDYFARNRYEQAIKEYDEAIHIYPQLAAAHNNMGSAYFALTRYDLASAAFLKAIQLDPNYGQAHFNLALTYLKLNRLQDADTALIAATRAYYITGDERLRAGDREAAEAAFKALLQIDPNYPPAHLRLGIIYNADHRYNEAVQAFKLVLKSQPQSAAAYENLGEAYYGQHKYTDALEATAHAIKLQPRAPGAYYIAGLAYAALDQPDGARAACAKLTELHADEYAQLLAAVIAKQTPHKP